MQDANEGSGSDAVINQLSDHKPSHLICVTEVTHVANGVYHTLLASGWLLEKYDNQSQKIFKRPILFLSPIELKTKEVAKS